MREKLLNHIKSFPTDNLCLVIAITNTVLAISMYVSPEQHNFFFWFTLGFRILTPIIALLFGGKGLWILYFIFCNVKALDITYNNYTVVAILSVLFALTPKVTKQQAYFVAGLYITDVFIVAGLHNKTLFYIYTHIMLSAQYVTAMWKMKVTNSKQKFFILTQDELEILNQLKDGNVKKQVEGFSETTIYRKLTEARVRNGCKTNNELLEKYKVSDHSTDI